MHPTYIDVKRATGVLRRWYYNVRDSGNHAILSTSELYVTRAGARRGAKATGVETVNVYDRDGNLQWVEHLLRDGTWTKSGLRAGGL